jgi:predicted amidophosphoribosyltransferase
MGGSSLASGLATLVVELVIPTSRPAEVITWVPAAEERLRETGLDHGRVLAELVADRLGVPAAPTLVRVRKTEPQMRLPRDARRRNLKGVFMAPAPLPSEVMLIDDVYTTGATASEAGRALKAGGARSVTVLCAARAMSS